MRSIFLLIPALALTACATPRESCIYDANRQLNSLQDQISTTQGNIDRGFALFEQTGTVVTEKTCQELTPEGDVRSFDCDETQTSQTSVPVVIDVAEERAKLKDLLQQLAPLQRATGEAVQRCIMIHPE